MSKTLTRRQFLKLVSCYLPASALAACERPIDSPQATTTPATTLITKPVVTPTLQDIARTIWTVTRPSFRFTLDIWENQDNNGHNRLLVDGGLVATVLLGACLFGKTNQFGTVT